MKKKLAALVLTVVLVALCIPVHGVESDVDQIADQAKTENIVTQVIRSKTSTGEWEEERRVLQQEELENELDAAMEHPKGSNEPFCEAIEIQGDYESLFTISPTSTVSIGEEDLAEYSTRYGYDYLLQTENGSVKQGLYNAIHAAVTEFHCNTALDAGEENSVISVDYPSLGLSIDDVIAVLSTYQDDNPLIYWLSKTVYYTEEVALIRADDEYASGADRAYYNELIDEGLAEYTSIVEGETSAYQIALAYHDAIIENINYAYDGSGEPESAKWAHNILGVFEKKSGVCESYARTFQLLLNASGIENLYVQGMAKTERHAWNLVCLDDGKWYWYDLTWDDTPKSKWGISYTYFCVSETQTTKKNTVFTDEHTPELPSGVGDLFLYELPSRAVGKYRAIGGEKLVGDQFRVSNITYSVTGYHTVQLIDFVNQKGTFVIPETVTYKDMPYSVISIGGMDNPGYGDGVFPYQWYVNDITSILMPKTMRYIWFGALRPADVEEIIVDPENPWFCSEDGVLFTKSKYTLIQYPNRNNRTSYMIPDETHLVVADSFENCAFLERLTIGKNVEIEGLMSIPLDRKPDDKLVVYSVVAGSMAAHQRALTGKQELLIHEENQNFQCIDGVIYNADVSNLLALTNKNITSITIENTVKQIDDMWLLEKHTQLEKIEVEDGSMTFSAQDGILYSAGFDEIIFVPYGKNGSVCIVEGVTSIGQEFRNHANLQHVILPDSVARIKEYAFSGCTGLKTVECSTGLEVIDRYAFENCTSLTSVSLEEPLHTIGEYAFSNCTSLQSISFPASLEIIEQCCFDNCTALEKVDLSQANPYIYARVFSYCSNLTTVLFSDDTETIPSNMFMFCGKLSHIDLPDSIISIEGKAFWKCSSLTEINLPQQLECIGELAFCETYLTHITIPKTVISLDAWSFRTLSLNPDTILFLGDAPDGIVGADRPDNRTFDESATLFYLEGTSGWTDSEYYDAETETWKGYKLRLHPAAEHRYEGTVTEPSCTQKGFTTYTCEACGDTYIDWYSYTDLLDHTTITLEAVEPTCTQPGYTEGSKCSICDTIIKPQVFIERLGHGERVTMEAVEPTCTQPGYTEGSKCSVCGEIIKPQIHIEALGHGEVVPVSETIEEATCTKEGSYIYVESCSVCGEELLRGTRTSPKKPHEESVVEAVAPTCTQPGYTEGSKCSVCDTIIKPQVFIERLGHGERVTVVETDEPATCSKMGKYVTVECCSICREEFSRKTVTIKKIPHTEVIVAGRDATCTENGLTQGKQCSICEEILLAQTVIPAKGHTEQVIQSKAATCTESGLTEGTECSVCNSVIRAQETIPATGHTYAEPNFTWNETCTAASAEHSCTTCAHTVSSVCSVISVSEDGKITITASAVVSGLIVKDERVIESSIEGNKATVRLPFAVSDLADDIQIMVASYDDRGRMTGFETLTVSEGMLELLLADETMKLFIVNELTLNPLFPFLHLI